MADGRYDGQMMGYLQPTDGDGTLISNRSNIDWLLVWATPWKRWTYVGDQYPPSTSVVSSAENMEHGDRAGMNWVHHQKLGFQQHPYHPISPKIQGFSPPARWGLLDFMSVASSSCLVLLSSSSPPPPLLLVLLVILVVLSLSSSSSCSAATRDPQCSLSDLNHDHPRSVFPAGPQPRPSPPSVPCRTPTTTIHAQCSLPDLNRDNPRPVFPAGPHAK